MSVQITPEVFEHLVRLAALELSPEEAEYLRRQLNHQLRAIDELSAIPIEPDTPLAAHGVPYTPAISQPLRADTWVPSLDAAAILSQAPLIEYGYIIVPEIPHTELE